MKEPDRAAARKRILGLAGTLKLEARGSDPGDRCSGMDVRVNRARIARARSGGSLAYRPHPPARRAASISLHQLGGPLAFVADRCGLRRADPVAGHRIQSRLSWLCARVSEYVYASAANGANSDVAAARNRWTVTALRRPNLDHRTARSACPLGDALALGAATTDALNMDNSVIVRAAAPADLDSLATLKEEWAALSVPATAAEHADFVRFLQHWMQERGESVVCLVAELDRMLVGMAWLIIFERVPNIGDLRRQTGDIQSVFVRPGFRGGGIGRQLISGLVAAADDMGIPRVTVSANPRAASLYESQGFVATPTILERRAR